MISLRLSPQARPDAEGKLLTSQSNFDIRLEFHESQAGFALFSGIIE
jgi:hypothetical protein